mgnify:CR=1 FL=1
MKKEINKSKKLGILGGMGSQATQYFFKKVIEKTDAKKDQDHINMIILNHASIPDRTEAILSGNHEEFLSLISEDMKIFEKYGAEHVAIPCNTSHYFYKEIQAMTKIPVINMVEETIKSISQNKDRIVKRVGILATDGTILTKIYEKECSKRGIEAVIPSEKSQKDIMSIIYDEIKSGKEGDCEKFMRVVEELRSKRCDVIVLACTELSYLKENNDLPEYCVDALEILAEKSVELSGKKLK